MPLIPSKKSKFDEILEGKIGFGKYQVVHILILFMIDADDGQQLVMMSIVNPILKKLWGLSKMELAFLTSLFYIGASIGTITRNRKCSTQHSVLCVYCSKCVFVSVHTAKNVLYLIYMHTNQIRLITYIYAHKPDMSYILYICTRTRSICS